MVNVKIVVNRWVLLVGIVMLVAGQTQAASLLTQLTPANLNKQQLTITVKCTATVKNYVFSVSVRHKAGVVNHFLHPIKGCFIDQSLEDGSSDNPLPYRVTTDIAKNGTGSYQFQLPVHYPPNIQFQFGYTGYDSCPAMPVGDFYQFAVSAFAHQKPVVQKPAKSS